jgi:hypothetical protein
MLRITAALCLIAATAGSSKLNFKEGANLCTIEMNDAGELLSDCDMHFTNGPNGLKPPKEITEALNGLKSGSSKTMKDLEDQLALHASNLGSIDISKSVLIRSRFVPPGLD